MIVLDTSILSLALRHRRRGPEPAEVGRFYRLVEHNVPMAVPGIVVQELLSGVRSVTQFEQLRERVQGFPILTASADDHIVAAQFRNRCLDVGIICSSVDALIAAQTVAIAGQLFTLDNDFDLMARHCGLSLYLPVK